MRPQQGLKNLLVLHRIKNEASIASWNYINIILIFIFTYSAWSSSKSYHVCCSVINMISSPNCIRPALLTGSNFDLYRVFFYWASHYIFNICNIDCNGIFRGCPIKKHPVGPVTKDYKRYGVRLFGTSFETIKSKIYSLSTHKLQVEGFYYYWIG